MAACVLATLIVVLSQSIAKLPEAPITIHRAPNPMSHQETLIKGYIRGVRTATAYSSEIDLTIEMQETFEIIVTDEFIAVFVRDKSTTPKFFKNQHFRRDVRIYDICDETTNYAIIDDDYRIAKAHSQHPSKGYPYRYSDVCDDLKTLPYEKWVESLQAMEDDLAKKFAAARGAAKSYRAETFEFDTVSKAPPEPLRQIDLEKLNEDAIAVFQEAMARTIDK